MVWLVLAQQARSGSRGGAMTSSGTGGGQAPFGGGQLPVVAVANRLPVQRGNGGWQLSPGGLVTALRPVMTRRSGAWVGWDGGTKGIPCTLPDFTPQLMPGSRSSSPRCHYYP